jgi:alkylhydroperoxidase family enzyme
VDERDPFPRRTATPARLAPWFVELARTLPGLARSFGPGAALDARTRERVIMAVTEVNGCRYCAWIHGSWQDFLGDTDAVVAEEALLTYARACADAGRPLPLGPLADVLPAPAVASLRATVAQIEVSNLVGNTVDGLIARFTRKRPFRPAQVLGEVATIAAALPLALPLLGVAAGMRTIDRMAPPLPDVEMPPAGEANLLAHLLAEALPTYLATAPARVALLRLPVQVAVALRAGRTAATIRIGRGRVAIENGVASDALAVVEGEAGPLLRLASGALLEELGHVRVRRA